VPLHRTSRDPTRPRRLRRVLRPSHSSLYTSLLLVGHRRPLKLEILDKNKTITALYTATYNGAGGPDNMALSPAAFAGLEDIPSDTSLSPVTWSFV
jgi:hypothetical protein